jgi:hypothetical protein
MSVPVATAMRQGVPRPAAGISRAVILASSVHISLLAGNPRLNALVNHLFDILKPKPLCSFMPLSPPLLSPFEQHRGINSDFHTTTQDGPTIVSYSHKQEVLRRTVKVKVRVILRPTVSRPVGLGVRHPSETRDQFFTFSL